MKLVFLFAGAAAAAAGCAEDGAHVLYNATWVAGPSAGGYEQELYRKRLLHAVVGDGSVPAGALQAACVGDVRTWPGPAAAVPEEFEHLVGPADSHVRATVARVTSKEDFTLIEALAARERAAASLLQKAAHAFLPSYPLATKLINEDRLGANAVDETGTPALSIAIQLRQPILAASLLNAYAPRCDANLATPLGYAPLHYAVGAGNPQIVKALLRRGADPNARVGPGNSGGWAPLHFACGFGDLKAVEALLEYDADPLLLGDAGENAFKVAEDASVDYTTRAALAGLLNGALAKRAPSGSGEL